MSSSPTATTTTTTLSKTKTDVQSTALAIQEPTPAPNDGNSPSTVTSTMPYPHTNGHIDSKEDVVADAKDAADPSSLAPVNFNEIKLEEGDPSAIAAALELDMDMDGGSIGGDRPQPSADVDYARDMVDDQRRVKVYELIENKWTDRGTAFCQSAYDEEKQLAKLIARSEDNPQDVILQFYIRGEDVYQRQQETLIVWTEPDGTDYALSFQDMEGCADVWDYILDVQRAINGERDRDENDEPSSSSSPPGSRPITFASIVNASQLPPPQLGIMSEVERAIKHVGRNVNHKEKLCEHIINTDYIRLMIDLAAQAEDLEQLEDLHALCTCMQTILLLNDHAIFEHITSHDIFLGVCGILEYDPEFPHHKACYREILEKESRFKQPIPFSDDVVRRKIHQTYRLQFLKDVVLTRVMEDSTFNALNSCVIFNQIDLITHFQTDESFLRQVVGLFTIPDSVLKGKMRELSSNANDDYVESSDSASGSAPSGLENRKRDVIFLIQQLCVMGKNVQLQARLVLFRTLVDRGLIHAVQWGLGNVDSVLISASAEVLAVLLEHDTNGIRQHIMRQADIDSTAPSLLEVMSKTMSAKTDLAVKNQLADCLKMLLETQLLDPPDSAVTGIKALIRQREDPVTEKFLEHVHSKSCIKTLFKPLSDIPEYKTILGAPVFLTPERSTLYFYLSELLCCVVQQHGFRSSLFIIDSALLPRIASLLTSREKHLRLVALRVFRSCLKLNNRNVINHLIKHEVILPIIDLTTLVSRRDNLLSSTCQEFFEYIRKENQRDLIHHIMTHYEAKMHALSECSVVGVRFKNFIRRWEQNTEPLPDMDDQKRSDIPNAKWGYGRGLELEEEDWFNGSDEEETPSHPPPWIQQQLASQPPLKRKRTLRSSVQFDWSSRRRRQPPSPTPVNSPQSSGLVDYDDDDPTPVKEEEHESPSSISGGILSPLLSQGGSTSPRVKAPQPIKLPTLGSTSEVLQTSVESQPVPPNNAVTLHSEPPSRIDKRRREYEDDDEMLERLASKGKRPSLSDSEDSKLIGAMPSKPAPVKEEGTKKIKLRLGAIGLGVKQVLKLSPSPGPATDGDGG